MQSEDLDKKIKDAADHHYPAYNERAWSKMKDLLDAHMPVEKKDRRRGIIFFLSMFLLLGGGAFLLINKPWIDAPVATESISQQNTTEKNIPSNPRDEIANKPTNENSNTLKEAPGEPVSPTAEANPVTQPGQNTTSTSENVLSNSRDQEIVNKEPLLTRKNGNYTIKPNATSQQKKKLEPSPINPGTNEEANAKVADVYMKPSLKFEKAETKPSEDKQTELKATSDKPEPNLPTTVTETVTDPVTAKSDKTDTTSKTETNATPAQPVAQKKKTSSNGFSISVSAGPDISGVGLNEWGKFRPVYGVGLGFTFANRFTIRTGFYTASKIYTASPKDYKTSSPPPSQVYLSKIDADCKVYEIPLNLAYRLGNSEKQNWFVSVGLSSFLMKSETYDYLYKYPNGSTYTHNYSYENENNHFLSILSLSGGYTRRLNRTFSLSAEPYFKLPLGGVGMGNIKLNSAGVMFTLGARIK